MAAHPGGDTPGRQAADPVGDRVGCHHGDHAQALVERPLALGEGDSAELADQAEDRRRRPGRPHDLPVHSGGQDPGDVGGDPAPGDVRHRVHPTGGDQVQDVERVDPGRLEQLLAEGPTELGHVAVQGPSGPVEQHVAGQRVAVRVQPAGGHRRPGRRPSRTRSGPRSSSASTTPVPAPATSYSSGASSPGCSAVSPPTRATPRGGSPRRCRSRSRPRARGRRCPPRCSRS